MFGVWFVVDGNNYVFFYIYIELFVCWFFWWDGVLFVLCCILYFYMVKLMYFYCIVYFDVNFRFENEDNVVIEIEGDGEDSGEIEILGVLEVIEEELVFLEFLVNFIDEGYVEVFNDGILELIFNIFLDLSLEEQYEDDDVEDLKQQLIDIFYGMERGLCVSSDICVEVIEFIMQLEVKNFIEVFIVVFIFLNGKWVLVYVFYFFLYNEN